MTSTSMVVDGGDNLRQRVLCLLNRKHFKWRRAVVGSGSFKDGANRYNRFICTKNDVTENKFPRGEVQICFYILYLHLYLFYVQSFF